ncbi:MAG: hypothetical protein JSS87_02405 [Acidobacteria bacterium]|nr:hypothetical protein [Acidobacteriota bacterium]
MGVILTDAEIKTLIEEPKPLPSGYLSKLVLKNKSGHRERELELVGSQGSTFRIILRQSLHNVLDFSAILTFVHPTSQTIRLRRYNGKSHEHTNKLERQTFYDFHIHLATGVISYQVSVKTPMLKSRIAMQACKMQSTV